MFQDYLGRRRPSFELRAAGRTMSCTVKQEGEGHFFLPANGNDEVAQSCVN